MDNNKRLIVLLGAANTEDGKLSTIAQERCEHAIIEYKKDIRYMILPTGGFGNHFNISSEPHGYYTTQYLLSRGIPKRKILKWIESSDTIEDARLSKLKIDNYGVTNLVIVTSDFHRERAEYIFNFELSNMAIRFSCCKTHIPKSKLRKFKKHERLAIDKIKDKMNKSLDTPSG